MTKNKTKTAVSVFLPPGDTHCCVSGGPWDGCFLDFTISMQILLYDNQSLTLMPGDLALKFGICNIALSMTISAFLLELRIKIKYTILYKC